MDIAIRRDGDVIVMALKGRLDLASGKNLKEAVTEQFADGASSLHLNMAEIEFVNSSGLGALVSIMKEIKAAQGRLTLSNLGVFVQELLDITQLSKVFEIFPTEADALGSYVTVSGL